MPAGHQRGARRSADLCISVSQEARQRGKRSSTRPSASRKCSGGRRPWTPRTARAPRLPLRAGLHHLPSSALPAAARTHRVPGVRVREQHALGGEPVEVRRRNPPVCAGGPAQHPHLPEPQVVRHHQHHVRRLGRRSRRRPARPEDAQDAQDPAAAAARQHATSRPIPPRSSSLRAAPARPRSPQRPPSPPPAAAVRSAGPGARRRGTRARGGGALPPRTPGGQRARPTRPAGLVRVLLHRHRARKMQRRKGGGCSP